MSIMDHGDSILANDRPRVIGSRVYDMDDQHWFAHFSGDYNPLHVDSLAARREMYGEVVVHGIHGVLNALHDFLGCEIGSVGSIRLERLRVRFLRPMVLGVPVRTIIKRRNGPLFRLALEDAQQVLATIDGTWAPSSDLPAILPARPERRRTTSLENS